MTTDEAAICRLIDAIKAVGPHIEALHLRIINRAIEQPMSRSTYWSLRRGR